MRQVTLLRLRLLAVLIVALLSGVHARAGSCGDLARLSLPHATITLAQSYEAGAFAPSGLNARDSRALPALCRVAATLTPSSDSTITIEVWMPATGWNGKFEAVGNGAFSGAIAYSAMATAIGRGYATSSTDTGHEGGSARFALDHPEKVIDFGWRAVHELTDVTKKIIAAFYAASPKFSYWNGCSAGGRQAMTEAQRFPGDYDGIIAGSPGLDWTGRAAQAVRIAGPLERDEAARLLQPQRDLLHRAVVSSCDALDGVTDGLIENPSACRFDPATLECKDQQTTGCLTRAQVDTARAIYASPKNPKSGRAITGLAPGSELGWTDLGWTASARATGLDQFRYLVFGDPAWTIQRFNFDVDIVRAEEVDANVVNALDPNLQPFLDRGGKLIQYHGWSDAQISPFSSTQYYTRVVDRLGSRERVDRGYRLFMAPGMGHCSGGEGPNTFDALTALEQWVEQHRAPDLLVASHASGGRVDRTRPLCPYPQVARYKATGSIDSADSFTCALR